MKWFVSLVLIFFLASCSCSNNEEKTWGPFELWDIAKKADPNIELVPIPNHEAHRRVLCAHYRTEGCVKGSGKRVKVRLVELLLIQYETAQQACEAALQVGQWYARNWLLDDVSNEPVLVDFVTKYLEAKKPKTKEDCQKP